MEFDWFTFGLEIFNFLILIWILKRFLYQPVLQTIARRKAAIDQRLADAKAKISDAETLERQYQDRLGDWEKEKQALLARVEDEIKATRASRMATLEKDLGDERDRRQMLEERRMEEWRKRTENEAVAQGAQFLAKLLSRLAAPELEVRLIAIALEDVKQLPDEQLQKLRAACRDGKASMTVTSAYPLSDSHRRALVQRLAEATRAQLAAHFAEDPRLLAGVRIGIGPWVLHANLQDELKFFSDLASDGAR